MKHTLFYVNSSYGLGHYVRSARIARKLGHEPQCRACIVAGGLHAPGLADFRGLEVEWLPSLTLHGDGMADSFASCNHSIQEILDERMRCLREIVVRLRPSALVLEYFPFSKRDLMPEVDQLIERCRGCVRSFEVFISVRDYIDESALAESDIIIDWINRNCKAVLVHSDPRLSRLDETFPDASRIACQVVHTGVVVAPLPTPVDTHGRISFSAGGGRDGDEIAEAAILTASSETLNIDFYIGPYLSKRSCRCLREASTRNGHLHLFDSHEYRNRVRGSSLVVGQAGYNTCWEAVNAGLPYIAIPRCRTEQLRRVARLQELGAVQSLSDPAELPRMIRAVERMGPPTRLPEDCFCGAERAATLIRDLSSIG